MSLLVTKVPRALDIKTKLFGFELGDLLLIFLYLALINFIFGSTHLKFPMLFPTETVHESSTIEVEKGGLGNGGMLTN